MIRKTAAKILKNYILGLDIGGSTTQAILLNRGESISTSSASLRVKRVGGTYPEFSEGVECLFSKDDSFPIKDIKKILIEYKDCPIAATGGGAKKLEKFLEEPFQNNLKIIDEIIAIGTGGTFLSAKEEALVVSIGTGTPMVAIKNNRIEHIGGTGMGGGTLKGLFHLIFKEENLDELERTAQKGKREKIDLKVRDIMGGAVGIVPADATASNFGRVKSNNKSDISLALFNMLAEAVGTLAFLSAKNYGLEKDIVFCGRVAENKIIKKRLMETVKLWGGQALVLEKARYACAIGAAKSLLL